MIKLNILDNLITTTISKFIHLMKRMKFRAAPNFLPAHTPSSLVSKQSGIVMRFIRIEPSFLKRFSGIISGSLNNISNLSLVSRLTSSLASTQKADMG